MRDWILEKLVHLPKLTWSEIEKTTTIKHLDFITCFLLLWLDFMTLRTYWASTKYILNQILGVSSNALKNWTLPFEFLKMTVNGDELT